MNQALARQNQSNVADIRREQYLEKPLPSNADAERVILGDILIDNTVINQVSEKLTPEDFYSPLNRRIFAAMLELVRAGKTIDPILIGEELKKEGSLESIGGVTTITNLTFGLPHFSNLTEYIETVKKKSVARNLIRLCNAVTSETLSEETEIEDILTDFQTKINQIASEVTINDGGEGFVRLAKVIELNVKPALLSLSLGESRKIATGFPAIDAALFGGISTSDVMVLAGLPSSGKSALALQMAFNIANAGTPAAFLAGEMTNMENVFRILSQVSGVSNVNSIFRLASNEKDTLDSWCNSISQVPLYLDHRTGDMHNLASRLRGMVKQTGIKVLVADYLQLFKMERIERRTRFERISEVSQELKRLANELDLAVIAVSQFNRSGAKSGSPSMFDSDGSSQIEKDASIYMIVDREEGSENVAIRIVKGRNTGTGTIHGRFEGRCVRFELG